MVTFWMDKLDPSSFSQKGKDFHNRTYNFTAFPYYPRNAAFSEYLLEGKMCGQFSYCKLYRQYFSFSSSLAFTTLSESSPPHYIPPSLTVLNNSLPFLYSHNLNILFYYV